MSNKPVQLLQGTLDIIVLPALWSMGPLHAYALARLEEVADERFTLNSGVTKSGRALEGETARWRKLAALIDKLLVMPSS